MNNPKKPKLGHNKKTFLEKPIEHIDITSFSLYGPTCDSADFMKGPFVLPNNLKEGDYIEIGQLGAYSLTFRTKFNGFYSNKIVEVQDKPIMTMYEKDSTSRYLVA